MPPILSPLRPSARTRTRFLLGRLAAQNILRPRRLVDPPKRILVSLYYRGLGDVILLTPLIAALRSRYPEADIVLTMPKAYLSLYSGRPYALMPVPFDIGVSETVRLIRGMGPYDLALVPGENRQAWLARAVGARWIRGFEGGHRRHRLAIDEPIPFPAHIEPFSDLWARLAGPLCGQVYRANDWPPPRRERLDGSPKDPPYVVLHTGASSSARLWSAGQWRALAEILTSKGLSVVLTSGPGQGDLLRQIDQTQTWVHYPGNLSLACMWHLLKHADLLVVPDTGIAHLAKITQTPTVVLFGQCDPRLYDPGKFWADMGYEAVTVGNIPCRDQQWFLHRPSPWGDLRRCMRTLEECRYGKRCMEDLTVEAVAEAALSLRWR